MMWTCWMAGKNQARTNKANVSRLRDLELFTAWWMWSVRVNLLIHSRWQKHSENNWIGLIATFSVYEIRLPSCQCYCWFGGIILFLMNSLWHGWLWRLIIIELVAACGTGWWKGYLYPHQLSAVRPFHTFAHWRTIPTLQICIHFYSYYIWG